MQKDKGYSKQETRPSMWAGNAIRAHRLMRWTKDLLKSHAHTHHSSSEPPRSSWRRQKSCRNAKRKEELG